MLFDPAMQYTLAVNSLAIWPVVDPDWPLRDLLHHHCITLQSRFYLPNLVAIGHSWAICPLVCPSWPVHDIWPHQCTTWTLDPSNVLLSGHGFFLPNLAAVRHFWAIWSRLTPAWPLTPLMHFTSVKYFIKCGYYRAFLSNLTPDWPWLTSVWSLTQAMHSTSVRGNSYQICWP